VTIAKPRFAFQAFEVLPFTKLFPDGIEKIDKVAVPDLRIIVLAQTPDSFRDIRVRPVMISAIEKEPL
jgi:hypothetical protein